MIRQNKFHSIIYISITIVWAGLIFVSLYLFRQSEYLRGQVDYLQQNQRIMIWQMDNSCFDQIKNNADGILRLKVGE